MRFFLNKTDEIDVHSKMNFWALDIDYMFRPDPWETNKFKNCPFYRCKIAANSQEDAEKKIMEFAKLILNQRSFQMVGKAGKCTVCGEDNPERKNGQCRGISASEHNWKE